MKLKASIAECRHGLNASEGPYFVIMLTGGGPNRWGNIDIPWRPPASAYHSEDQQRKIAEELIRRINTLESEGG